MRRTSKFDVGTAFTIIGHVMLAQSFGPSDLLDVVIQRSRASEISAVLTDMGPHDRRTDLSTI